MAENRTGAKKEISGVKLSAGQLLADNVQYRLAIQSHRELSCYGRFAVGIEFEEGDDYC